MPILADLTQSLSDFGLIFHAQLCAAQLHRLEVLRISYFILIVLDLGALWYYFVIDFVFNFKAGVAQLVRAPGCGSGGRGFETRRLPHLCIFSMIDILFFAAIAGLIFYKLFNQLGKLDEFDKKQNIKKHISQKINKTAAKPAQVIDFRSPMKEEILADKAKNNAANEIFAKAKMSSDKFLQGASKALELIIKNFAESNKEKLKDLCEKNIYDAFAKQIDEYQKQQSKLNTQIVSVDESKITDASIEDGYAKIQINFKSKQINYVTDGAGQVIDGSASDINEPEDIWIFRKKLNSASPKWLLFSTK